MQTRDMLVTWQVCMLLQLVTWQVCMLLHLAGIASAALTNSAAAMF